MGRPTYFLFQSGSPCHDLNFGPRLPPRVFKQKQEERMIEQVIYINILTNK